MNLTRRSVLMSLATAAALPRTALAGAPLNVVATTGMVADAVRAIAGDMGNVTALMGPGIDPHAYRQTRTDIVALSRADLILWNGLYLEAQLEDLFADLAGRKSVIPVAEATPAELLLSHEDYEGRFDPHIWMDPQIWAYAVAATRDALIEAAPDHAGLFQENAATYLADIARVGSYARETLMQVPQEARVLVSAHDAFNYFGAAYGFEVEGIQGISTESEAGLQRIAELVDMLVDRGIGAVFVESSVSDRNLRALIEGAAAKGHEVRIGGELFSDAMGMPGTYEGTYVGMIDHNATTIAGALGVETPAGGMDGKLGGVQG